MPLKVLLILDNGPAHPQDLEELAEEFPWFPVKFLSPSTTLLLKPTDQNLIANFKKLYNKEHFLNCFQMVSDIYVTLKELYKKYYNILSCVGLGNVGPMSKGH